MIHKSNDGLAGQTQTHGLPKRENMSRAFVKESDGGQREVLPPRRISEHPNLVTARGLEQLRRRQAELTRRRSELMSAAPVEAAADELRYVDRDLTYVSARLASAQPVDEAGQPRGQVAFGARVTVLLQEQPGGERPERTFTIVGEDEADADAGLISYVSPLARALDGARVGQSVTWRRPIGDLTVTVLAIAYGP